jgi:hypothetical protein
MKKTYLKPVAAKRDNLAAVTAGPISKKMDA